MATGGRKREVGSNTVPGARTRPAASHAGDDAAGDANLTTVDRFWLLVTAGPDAAATFSTTSGRMVVGTHQSCDLLLTDPTVSRFHCEIVSERGHVLIRDLDSRNGTRVGGVRVVQAFLRAGATLKLGKTQLRFDLGSDRVALPPPGKERFGLMVGRAASTRQAFALLERAAASDATVLLEGETGTGKEVAAESLHREGKRAAKPFLVVDCGAVPPDLLESELFGHSRGAFTGAVAAREGVFAAADGGTVFLDEIGELSPELQPKLLRVLERREVKRVGTNAYVPVDVRVIAATNRDLRAEVNAKRFRSDLYYRLAVLQVRLPALRERLDDLPLLVEHLLGPLQVRGAEAEALRAEDFLGELARHSWPGNVRELRNYLERCVALRDHAPLAPVEGGPATDASAPIVDVSVPLKEARERWTGPFERRYLEELLKRHGDNVSAAARAAGIDRVTFYRLLWRHGFR